MTAKRRAFLFFHFLLEHWKTAEASRLTFMAQVVQNESGGRVDNASSIRDNRSSVFVNHAKVRDQLDPFGQDADRPVVWRHASARVDAPEESPDLVGHHKTRGSRHKASVGDDTSEVVEDASKVLADGTVAREDAYRSEIFFQGSASKAAHPVARLENLDGRGRAPERAPDGQRTVVEDASWK